MITIFGIRHHGPGSARSLQHALTAYQPDILLVEGPPDAAEVLPLAADPTMRPPIALLIYVPDVPRRAVYYPFAEYSPEWQALRYAAGAKVQVHFMDLPQRFQLGTEDEPHTSLQPTDSPESSEQPTLLLQPARDPIGALALAAGYSDGERWWEHMVEQRQSHVGLFEAILEAMTALREAEPPETNHRELQREAWMRQTIRQAQNEGHERVAVVCGAWHAPALTDLHNHQHDADLLAALQPCEVHATWVPWTYGRLAISSGYGAGVESPGWYEHLWQTSGTAQRSTEVATRWIARIARLLRTERIDASSAHVIEAVRLAETLAALRERPLPGLPELTEAAQSIFWSGSDLPMRLIHQQLIVGERLGAVPEATPLAPLQRDLANLQRRLRLQPEASWRDYDLDLRKPHDLERSHLLHRLTLLGIGWGKLQRSGGGKGTFHELWRLEWQPELAVAVIEAGIWGNTIGDAATAYLADRAAHAPDLPTLTQLVDQALLADLPSAVSLLMERIAQEAAISSDVAHLMAALPPLANILRYGNVRNTDTQSVAHVVDGLVTRMSIGLPSACTGLNDQAAEGLFQLLLNAHNAVALLEGREMQAIWYAALLRLVAMEACHGLIAGRAVRLLLDAARLDEEQSARYLSVALSSASEPAQAAAWIEGFIRGSGSVLVHDQRLWQIIDVWMLELPPDVFTQVVPFLRRTFSSFSAPERRALAERARMSQREAPPADPGSALSAGFDYERAEAALAVIRQLLGIAEN